jgi:predicted O-methyltransferase YrrM
MNASDVQRVFVINLDRATDRWDALEKRIAELEWPFPKPERFSAIEEDPPADYQPTRGAWGCLQSHLAIYKKCREEGVTCILVLEDDCVFREGFMKNLAKYLEAVPDDWQQVYLGGHHGGDADGTWLAPEPVNDQVVKCACCNTTHAYVVNISGMMAIDGFLADIGRDVLRDPNCHIDTIWGTMHCAGLVTAYAPWRFLCGQAAGPSFRVDESFSEDMYFDMPPAWFALHNELLPPHVRPNVRGWLLPEEGEALYRLAAGRGVLEIGTWCGLSALTMEQSARFIVCVDHFQGDGDIGPADVRAEALANLATGVGIFVEEGDQADIIPTLNVDAFDLVFYDADHSYESTRKGIDLLVESGLRPPTIVAFHDFNKPGVERAVREFAKEQGRTILLVGTLAVT